jgi:hypothetical protein
MSALRDAFAHAARQSKMLLKIINRLRSMTYVLQDLLAGRQTYLLGRNRFGKAPSSLPQNIRLKIGCYGNWPDFNDALGFLTPNSSGVWNDVAFVSPDNVQTDWTGIFNQPKDRAIEIVASPNRVFFAIGEPPTKAHRPLHLGQGQGSTVFTCDSDLVADNDGCRDYVLTPSMLRTWSVRRTYDQLRKSTVRDKRRQLSWITSDTAMLAGHRYRLKFLSRLEKEMPLDLFGRGFRRVYDKWDVLAPYRYSIAFENMRAPYYFTEKLMDCFVCETMPIYFGSPQITTFFPKESLVVIDPEAPNVMEQIRSVAESNLWQSNRDAILEAKRLVLDEYNIFAMLARLVSSDTRPALPPALQRIDPVHLDFSEDE